jgi:hypothetical protein
MDELYQFVMGYTRLYMILERLNGKREEREMCLRTHQNGTQDGLQGEVHDPRLQMQEVHNSEGGEA